MDRKINKHFRFEANDDVNGVLATLDPDAAYPIVGYPTGPTHGRENPRAFRRKMFADLSASEVSLIKRLSNDNAGAP